jgi:cell division protease FtsH
MDPSQDAMFNTKNPSTLAVLFALALSLGSLFVVLHATTPKARQVSYTELVEALREGKIEQAELRADQITVRTRAEEGKAPAVLVVARIPNVDESPLVKELLERNVKLTGKVETTPWWSNLLWLLPFLLLPWLLLGGAARAVRKNQPLSFGRSKAKLYDRSKENRVTFADVAGVDEARAELEEIVGFLKKPDEYRAVGARVPKGVLLVGAPGTGKTLLAKAVAGESGVPFFSMSGSEFVEMFVGVGASRVRDLFEQAKQRAPCIIFIDELDAVGKSRSGGSGFVANEEREQTLNQLLVEMDGFDSGSGMIIMAATNRPEILDRALLRAGRFDRQVLVDRPDVRGREAILVVHARKVLLHPDVDLKVIAQRTPGMVGADLANVVNEAALASVRRRSKSVTAADFEEAIDRIQLGLKKEGRVMTEDERRRVAFHEAGHALVALSMRHADPVHRVTIIPRSIGALGATLQLPTEERYLMTREELKDRICVLLGGRSAEEAACHDVSTGAQDDLERATEMARQMVCRFGMSDVIGPVTFGQAAGSRFLLGTLPGDARNYSEETARVIDAEVKAVLERELARARDVLRARDSALRAIAGELLARETLQRPELEALARTTGVASPLQRRMAVNE